MTTLPLRLKARLLSLLSDPSKLMYIYIYSLGIFIIRTLDVWACRLGYAEDRLFRNIEAAHAFHLELPRLANFSITLEDGIKNGNVTGNGHFYRAVPRGLLN